MHKYKLVGLDLDGTLCYPKKPFETIFQESFGFPLETVQFQWMDQITKNNPCTGLEAVKEISKNKSSTEIRKLFENFSHQWAANQILFPGVDVFLSNIRSIFDGKIIILTNGPSYFQHSVVNFLGLPSLVDHVFASGDKNLGIRKPNLECFTKVQKFAEVEPSECLFIGDSFDNDYHGAKNAGWDSIWVEPQIKKLPENRHSLNDFITYGRQNDLTQIKLFWEELVQ